MFMVSMTDNRTLPLSKIIVLKLKSYVSPKNVVLIVWDPGQVVTTFWGSVRDYPFLPVPVTMVSPAVGEAKSLTAIRQNNFASFSI